MKKKMEKNKLFRLKFRNKSVLKNYTFVLLPHEYEQCISGISEHNTKQIEITNDFHK